MDGKSDGYFEERKLALAGRINLKPMYAAMLINLVLAFLSYIFYDRLADGSFASAAIHLGQSLSPSVSRMPAITTHPDRCAFVLSIQWVASISLIVLLLTKYWPFSKVMRVAVRTWYKQPEDRLPSHRNLRVFGFMLFVLACAAGDTGLWTFPTLYNGLFFADSEPLRAFVAMVNSPVYLPFLAWFSVLATVMTYWGAIFLVANWWTIVE
ncbi:hypothetical protein DVT68_20185 [Dyella solisilvae]|uniref:Uncharacterized protein n=1 Tax=Dyella solisilvae TaxID=1920168 RepID=A0A370K283_9GAMM|nr:hypothetical protein [Dyella solisilvae]RDI96776.1 hypothetical protein DVT68_20185 [Dyella solisilvae]